VGIRQGCQRQFLLGVLELACPGFKIGLEHLRESPTEFVTAFSIIGNHCQRVDDNPTCAGNFLEAEADVPDRNQDQGQPAQDKEHNSNSVIDHVGMIPYV
jgi:hypothetical protein